MVEFGERIMYVNTKNYIGPRLNKGDMRAEPAIFLGVRAISNEIYVGLPSGVKKVRTIHRVSEDRRWNPTEFEGFRGLPWKRDAEDARELPIEDALRPLPLENGGDDRSARLPQSNEQQEPEKQPRNFKIYKVKI